MKLPIVVMLSFNSILCLGQSTETITQKIGDKICNCMSDSIKNYSNIKSEFNRCYDKEFNFIFDTVDSTEHRILIQPGALEKVKNNLIPYLYSHCEKIKKALNAEIKDAQRLASINKIESFPTNFGTKEFQKIKKWENKIISIEGDIIQIEKSRQNTPYYKIKFDAQEIWVTSMMENKFGKIGDKLRIIGYLFALNDDDKNYTQKLHKEKYHILSFGIVDLKTNEIRYYPNSEMQIIEWINGKIPKQRK